MHKNSLNENFLFQIDSRLNSTYFCESDGIPLSKCILGFSLQTKWNKFCITWHRAQPSERGGSFLSEIRGSENNAFPLSFWPEMLLEVASHPFKCSCSIPCNLFFILRCFSHKTSYRNWQADFPMSFWSFQLYSPNINFWSLHVFYEYYSVHFHPFKAVKLTLTAYLVLLTTLN